jgi:predicted Zn-dependent protease
MMIERIKAAISAQPSIADWRISEMRRSGAEWYFIGESLDSARAIEALDYRLSVYVDAELDGKKLRGEASVILHPTMSDAEIRALVSRSAFAASKARNAWYPLVEPAAARTVLPRSAFEGKPPEAWIEPLREALYKDDSRESGAGRINSLELILTRSDVRIVNSRGVDAAFPRWRGYIEYTVEASGGAGDVELTDDLAFSEPDPLRLSSVLRSRLEIVRDRAGSRPTPSLAGLPLVLAGRQAEAVLEWFFTNIDAARVFRKASPFEMGGSVHGTTSEGFDPISLTAEAVLPGAPESAPFDAEGFPLVRTPCIAGGLVTAFIGPSRYAHYLGRPVAGAFPLFSVAPGSLSAAELRSGPHLEVAFFSDFTVDPDSGDFGGEIRLGYWFDGKERKAVSGGSVTGSLFENRGGIRLSRETLLSGRMQGPEALLLPLVSVTGAA